MHLLAAAVETLPGSPRRKRREKPAPAWGAFAAAVAAFVAFCCRPPDALDAAALATAPRDWERAAHNASYDLAQNASYYGNATEAQRPLLVPWGGSSPAAPRTGGSSPAGG